MLKVVGASWYKTRIGTYILAGALMLAIAALFLADMERPNYSGTYCATTYWARNSGYRMEFWGQQNDLDRVPKGVVRACFHDSVLTNGWSQLEIESQSSYIDTVQAYAAGMLEGALTWHNIYMHWSNTIDAVCSRDPESEEFCEWLRGLITTNVDTVKKMADMKGKHDHYWYQIALFYDQLDGLEIGFRKGVRRSRLEYEIPKQDFLLMNAAVDIRDLKIYYTKFLMEHSGLEPEPAKGMMLLKLLRQPNGLWKILLSHTSDGSYSSMLRMVKKYTLRYHFSSEVSRLATVPKLAGEEQDDPRVVPGTNIVFTGYPGVLASLDDFYVIKGRRQHRLLAAGVKMDNEHVNLWRKIDLVRSVSLAPRVMSANRLGYSGRTWARYFARNPSTGVKQWLVIDMGRFMTNNESELDQQQTMSLPLVVGDRSVEENEIPTTLQEEQVGIEHQRVVTKRMDDYVDDDFQELQSSGRQVRMVTVPAAADLATSTAHDGEIPFRSGMFWVIDQLPGRLHAEDVTEKIAADGHWLTNGVPYFKEVLDIGHVKTNTTNTTQLAASKGKILNNITDLETLAKFIRQSAYRGDLDQDRPAAFGNIDLKLYAESNDGAAQFRAYSGPLYDPTGGRFTGSTTGQAAKRSILGHQKEQDQSSASEDAAVDTSKPGMTVGTQPFDWSRILPFEVRHQGHPDVWDFEHIAPEWAWL